MSNDNLKEFLENKRNTIGLININYPKLSELTEINSYTHTIEEMTQKAFLNLEEAITEKEITFFKSLPDLINDYIVITISIVGCNIVHDEVKATLKRINVLLLNWFRMVEELDTLKYELSEEKLDWSKKAIYEIEDILDLNMSIQNLVRITNKLIGKAETVLAATPKSFNLSRHLADAIKKEINK